MARTKSTRTSSTGRKASASAKTSKSAGTRKSAQSQNDSSSDDSISFSRARDLVTDNVNLQTAGFALAGAGILALVSTAAGRALVKSAAATVAKLATDSFGEYFGASENDETTERQTPSRQRDQARI